MRGYIGSSDYDKIEEVRELVYGDSNFPLLEQKLVKASKRECPDYMRLVSSRDVKGIMGKLHSYQRDISTLKDGVTFSEEQADGLIKTEARRILTRRQTVSYTREDDEVSKVTQDYLKRLSIDWIDKIEERARSQVGP